MSLLHRLLNPGNERTHSAVTLSACAALCVAVIVLAVGAVRGCQVQVEFTAAVAALGTLVGYVYRTGKGANVDPQ